jgi:hypothetical protein
MILPITSIKKRLVDGLTDILHDLDFEIAELEPQLKAGELALTLTDQSMSLIPGKVAEFRFCIYDVENLAIIRPLEEMPGLLQLNRIKYDERGPVVVLTCAHPIKITCKIRRLHLRLEGEGMKVTIKTD